MPSSFVHNGHDLEDLVDDIRRLQIGLTLYVLEEEAAKALDHLEAIHAVLRGDGFLESRGDLELQKRLAPDPF